MKKLIGILCIALVAAKAVFSQASPASAAGNVEEREVSNFSSIDITDGIQLFLSQGKPGMVKVIASQENYRQKIKTVVIGDVLKVYFDYSGDKDWKGLVNSKEQFKVYVSVEDVKVIKSANGATVNIQDRFTSTGPVDVRLESGGGLLGALHGERVTIDLRSGAFARLKGDVRVLQVKAIGGSSFRSFALSARSCSAYASSGSKIHVTVREALEAKAVNEADIKFKGNGKLVSEVTEAGGSIEHM